MSLKTLPGVPYQAETQLLTCLCDQHPVLQGSHSSLVVSIATAQGSYEIRNDRLLLDPIKTAWSVIKHELIFGKYCSIRTKSYIRNEKDK